MKDGRNAISNAVLAIILVLVVIGVTGAHLKISELKEQVAELKSENENLKSENEKLSTEMKNSRALLDVLAVNMSASSAKIKRLEKTVAGLEKSAKTRDKAMVDALADIGAEINGLKNNLEAIKKDAEYFKNENYENLELVYFSMDIFINKFEEQIESLEKTAAEMKEKTAELEKKMKKKRTCPLPPWKKNKK